jgi:two-component system response regulator HydG
MKSILIVDDDKDICLLLSKFLAKKSFTVSSSHSGASAMQWIRNNPVDLVLLDFKLPDYTGIEILEKIKIGSPDTQVIIITGYSDVRRAIDSLKKGAFDYVSKPLYPDEILMTINSALEKKDASDTKRKDDISVGPREEFIVGVSPQYQSSQKHIELIAPTDMSVVILGETGTGKEFVAREIHNRSSRSQRPFVAVDCGALPKNLVGSELFGHVKGAFTGAISDKKGCFEQADGGTIFLDEIGNLSYENQNQLLRVLQDHKVKRVGGIKSIQVDVRLIIATNENLKELVVNGDFREDIYHRINEFTISLAPLRERPEDIELFAREFVKMANDQLRKHVEGIDEDAMDILKSYYWHGNLRELRNVIKRAVLMCQGRRIDKMNLPIEIIQGSHFRGDAFRSAYQNFGPKRLKAVTEEAEKQAIIDVLHKTDNNKTRAADLLGIDRKTLYNKMNAYKIQF